MADLNLNAPQVMTSDDVREKAAVQNKYGVGEKEFDAAFPGKVERFHVDESGIEHDGPDATGYYEWRVNIPTNDGHGKLTRENQQAIEMMSPLWRADQERHGKLQSRAERVALMDEAGSAHFVPAERADATAKRNGWRHRFMRGRGRRLMQTIRGELYRWTEGEWVKVG